MAGRSSVETLKKLEIYTIGDLAQTDPEILTLHLKSHGRMLWESANGKGDSCVVTEKSAAKGIGNSTTLSKDVTTDKKTLKQRYGNLQGSSFFVPGIVGWEAGKASWDPEL